MFNTILLDFSIEPSFLIAKSKDFNLKTSCWTKATVISDDDTDWNIQDASEPDIAVDANGTIHVVWYDDTDGEWGDDREILYVNYTGGIWSNVTCISDIYGWNNESSDEPRIAIDKNGGIHVVWRDYTHGWWGTDYEIFYVNYTAAGWSNATVISDDNTNWNNGASYSPKIAIDKDGTIHVVWYDDTDGEWENDYEIMYTKSTATGWANATVISDDNTTWNDGSSWDPDIAIDDNGNIHVVWHDGTNGWWGSDWEIMYTNNTGASWTNATVISDDITNWNMGSSDRVSIATDKYGNVHVVWRDFTDGIWGSDEEIMYSYYNGSWSNATVISDDNTDWNTDTSVNAEIESDKYGIVHVVWQDSSNGVWGTDQEIMYAKRTSTGWSKARVISDDSSGWNNGESERPGLSIDKNGTIHVVWQDHTNGTWGLNREIMYCKSIPSKGEGPNIGLLLFQTLTAKKSNLLAIIIFLGLIGLVIAIGLYGYFKSKM